MRGRVLLFFIKSIIIVLMICTFAISVFAVLFLINYDFCKDCSPDSQESIDADNTANADETCEFMEMIEHYFDELLND